MCGWASRARARASRVKRSGETRLRGERGRENFQSDERVEPRLAHLEDDAHAAVADDFEHFVFGKSCAEFFERGHAGGGGWAGSGGLGDAEQRAGGADAAGGIGGDGRLAAGAGGGWSLHGTRFLRDGVGEVTKFSPRREKSAEAVSRAPLSTRGRRGSDPSR